MRIFIVNNSLEHDHEQHHDALKNLQVNVTLGDQLSSYNRNLLQKYTQNDALDRELYRRFKILLNKKTVIPQEY